MSNWLSGLRRSGSLLLIGFAALIASSGLMHAQNFAVKNLTKNTAAKASYPNLVVDGKGNTYLAFADSVNGVVVFTQFDGVKFNAQTTVPTSSALLPAFQPQVAAYVNSGTGPNVEIVWAAVHPASNPTTYDVYASRSDNGGGSFSAPVLVSAVTGPVPLADSPRVAFDTSGKVNIVWGQTGVWINQSVNGISFPSAPTSLLNPPTPLPNTGGPRVAVDVFGNIYVAWSDVAGATAPGSYCLPGAPDTASSGGNFWMNETLATPAPAPPNPPSPANTRNLSNTDWASPNRSVSDIQRFPNGFFGCSFDNLSLFVDGMGRIHLLWSDEAPVPDILTSETHGTYKYQAGSPYAGDVQFSFPINLANLPAASPQVAVDKAGSFYVVWSGGPTGGKNSEGIFFSRSDDGGSNFIPEANIAPSGSAALPSAFPQVAVDSSSNVNITWEQPTAQIKGDGSDVFNVFFARSTDRGNTFPTVLQVTTNPSVLCIPPTPTGTTPPTTPDTTTCGTVQIGVDAKSTPEMVWVNQASGAVFADIDFATSTSPTGTISPNAASLTASSATKDFTITVNGFTAPITFSCLDADKKAPLPSWLACSFNPATLNPALGNTDTLTITRQGTPTSGMFISAPPSHNLPAFGSSMALTMALATMSLMAMLMLVMGRRRNLSRALVLRGFLVMTLTVVLAAGLVSCSGGKSNTTSGTTTSGGTTSGTGTGGGTTGGTGGTGGGSAVTVHVAVQATSGGSTTTLGTVTITAQ